MKTVRVIYFILWVFLLISCGSSNAPSDILNIITIEDHPIENLNEIIEDVQVLKLDGEEHCPVSYISKLQFYKNRIYIKNSKYNVVVFDSRGSCSFLFDRVGEGPGYYDFFADFNVDPKTGNMEILGHFGVFYRYDQDGKYIDSRRINMPDNVVTFQRFKRISEDRILLFQWGFNTDLIYIYSFSQDSIVGSYLHTLDQNRYYNYMLEDIAYDVKGSFRYFNDQTNTIYNISEDGIRKDLTLQFNGKIFDWNQYQRESSSDEMILEYIERKRLNHPILGFASDLSIILAYNIDHFQYYVRSSKNEGKYLILSCKKEDAGKFVLYLSFAESRDANGDLRLYGAIYDNTPELKQLINHPSIDSTERHILKEFRPGIDNPIIFSYKLRRDM